jgi:glycosyltransferase involved in cell wall biosynthesis
MNFNLVLPNLAGGGAELAMLRLAGALGKRGHEVRLLLLEDRVDHVIPAGVAVTAVGRGQGSKGFIGKWLGARRLGRALRDAGRSSAITISTLPFADEVAARAAPPNLWFRIANTLSAEIDQLRRHDSSKAERRLARYRALYEGRDLVAVSDGVAADLREALSLRKARIERIYNGFDLEAIRAAAQAPVDLPPGPFVVHAGRFMPQKRHDLLLDAWKLAGLPHRLVLLAAPDPALDAMIEARGLRERVMVAGFQKNPYPWMRAAELLVLSSDREGMPNVLVEALACGTRVVSTDCPSGPREVLRGELARWLVPCGDAAALAERMRSALVAPRPGAGAVPEEFTEAHMARAYESLFAPVG